MGKFDFKEIPKGEWPRQPERLDKVFKSDSFLVQQWLEKSGHIRISVNKIKRKGESWKDGITWDQLQEIKNRVGFSDFWAVEVFPKSSSLVNVASMRHIFILNDKPDFAWGV